MCFEHDARPPELPADLALAPIAGGASAELIELTSADGTRFSAALAESPGGHEPGVVILPDVRGLYGFYVELAERFSLAGHHAIAIDYFGRTAGTGTRGDEFDYLPHVLQTKPEQVQADAAAAIAALRERTGASGVISVGFCFGGLQSLLAGANDDLGLDGVVSFYGRLNGSHLGIAGPRDRVAEIGVPVLGLYGGADESIPVAEVEEFESLLAEAGTPHEFKIYPGAPHSFFDRSFAEHAEASEDAWRRMLAFMHRVGSPAG